MDRQSHIEAAIEILKLLGLPRGQQNARSALCLLALLNLTPEKEWSQAETRLMGVTPIMDWARAHYGTHYQPNTRETFRRQSLHQFIDAGIILYNPDQPLRPTNSPKACYQIEETTLALLRTYETATWETNLADYLSGKETLSARYANLRKQSLVPVQIMEGETINLSPGPHSELIQAVITEFAPRHAPGSRLVYVGDTGEKWGYFDQDLLMGLGVNIDIHGKMPDVVLYLADKNWLLLVEAVTSHGPVDGKRHSELARLFSEAKSGLVFVTAFPTRSVMARYLLDIAWETEVWVADAPSHLIHFDGERFLGPYRQSHSRMED
jgi:type II restriction enzyme